MTLYIINVTTPEKAATACITNTPDDMGTNPVVVHCNTSLFSSLLRKEAGLAKRAL